MSLSEVFTPSAAEPSASKNPKREAPFSLRLSETEKADLLALAEGQALGSYIKGRLFGERARRRRSVGLPIRDKNSLARALALLGQSRLSSNLNQLAKLANAGALPMTLEVEAELRAALQDVREVRRLLFKALGLKSEVAS